jgi:dihydropteroate synthase
MPEHDLTDPHLVESRLSDPSALPRDASARPSDGHGVAWHRPQLMGICNVNADSFSDPRSSTDLDERTALAVALHRDGAAFVDVGAESASPATPALVADSEIAALVPVLERLTAVGVTTSVDTYKTAVAAAALGAGAAIVNDYSGLVEPELAGLCAAADARLVLTHNPAGVKHKLLDPDRYSDVNDDVSAWFDEQLARIETAGLPPDRVLLDPGIDLSKTPAQSIEVLRGLPRLRARFDQPLLVAVSRKDLIGALTGAPPRDRDPGTLATLAVLARVPDTIARVHDVAAATQYLDVLAAVDGPTPPGSGLALPVALRRQG